MPMKSKLQAVGLVLILCFAIQSHMIGESPLMVELSCSRAPDLLDTEMTGTLVNRGASAIDVTLSSATFPFEVEALDKMGHDVLARHRKPAPTSRSREPATQTIHLGANEKKTVRITLRVYLDSRGMPHEVNQVERLRLLVAASTEGSEALSVFRSNVVDLVASR